MTLTAILGAALGVIAALAIAFLRGRSSAKADQRAAQDRATIETRNRIDEAAAHAPTDADAARAALAKRVRDDAK